LKRNINWTKGKKNNQKNEDKNKIKNKNKILIEEWNWKKINSTKDPKKKNIYIYIYRANWDGRMKLKTNKTSIRGSRKIFKIKRIRTEVEIQITKRVKL